MINRMLYYYSKLGLSGLVKAIQVKLGICDDLVEISEKGISEPFYLRLKSSDLPTYEQVFVDDEYGFSIKKSPEVIVDAGANIGLASIYFANRFPDAQIVAVEPEASNFDLLKRNISPYPNIVAVQAALWHKNERIALVDPGLGNWGFMTEGADKLGESDANNLSCMVEAMTVDAIMDMFDLKKIDLLKIDIESAEKEVFSDTSEWIGKVDSMIVELHERMKEGCNRSFYNGSNGFSSEWTRGENVCLSRGNYLVQ